MQHMRRAKGWEFRGQRSGRNYLQYLYKHAMWGSFSGQGSDVRRVRVFWDVYERKAWLEASGNDMHVK